MQEPVIRPLPGRVRYALILVAFIGLQILPPDPAVSSFEAKGTFSVTPLWRLVASELFRLARRHAPTLDETLMALAGEQDGGAKNTKSYKIASVSSRQYSDSDLFWPVNGEISSGFGMRRHPITRRSSFHTGIDIRSMNGTPIACPIDGIVVSASRAGAMGREVRIQSGNMTLVFGHLSAYRCKVGQRIRAGQLLGLVGSSGRTTGPHLHFAIKHDGRWVNPLPYLTARRLASR
ncbi:MAG TPA: M23 family metallopeptidase [Candidatus Ozemobacteraceae bacterium]|nr:M23 family metallopeptidase [Candidatus Ozemobacteraceae bacterium]